MFLQRQRAKKFFEALQQDFLHSLVPACLIGAFQWLQSYEVGGVRSVHQSIRCFQACEAVISRRVQLPQDRGKPYAMRGDRTLPN